MQFMWNKKIEENYLVRWGIRSIPLTIYVHKYTGGDPREHVHNHPWKWWCSIVVKGYLDEEIADGEDNDVRRTITRSAPHFHFSKGVVKHRIRRVKKGSITLFFGIWRVREWEFFK